MQNQPLVSIGMPVYNGEKYIRDALDSLLAQTYRQFELIISDNASTDETEAICQSYAARDQRIHYIRQPTNLGAANNFHFVLEAAQGEYFMWAAHDDYWCPHFISDALVALNKTAAGFAFPTFKLKSIKLGLSKRIPKEIFQGFEHRDRTMRLLNFVNLHQSSHKCTLVYSLFKTTILRAAVAIQSIASDSLLSVAILGSTHGAIINSYCFQKRYPMLWPGFRKKLILRNNKRAAFEKDRDEIAMKTMLLYPDIKDTVERVRQAHRPSGYHKNYQIIKNLY